MGKIIINRLLMSVVVIWGVVTMVFVILRLVPGDPAELMLGISASPQQITDMRHQLGLDRPVAVQYAIFLGDAARGDFGNSIRYSEPAMRLILDRVPATLQLAIPALILAILVAIPLGMIAAIRSNSVWDTIISVLTLGAQSMPNFWVGIMLILFLSVNLGLLPTSGRGTWQQMVMPIVTLAFPLLSVLARFVRTGMLDHLSMDYVRTARAKGLGQQVVYFRHVLRNVLIPVVTTIGLQAGTLLGGSVIVENVFAWPGMGRMTSDSILNLDYPVVQAGVLVIALFIVSVNLIVDLVYIVVDPRVRVQ